MWQSMLMAAPSVTIGFGGFAHSNSDFPHLHSKVHNLQTLASYRLPEKFRSIALHPKSSAIRFCDSSTDSVTGSFEENGNINDRCITVAKKWVRREDIGSVVNLLSGSLPSLKSKLDDMKLNLEEELVTEVLQCHYRRPPGSIVIDFVKWAAGRDSRIVTTKVLDELIRAVPLKFPWSDETKPVYVYSLWGFLQEALCRYNISTTTEMLNEMIDMFSYWGEGMAAYLIFNNFENFQCERDADSYYLTIKALYFTDTFNYKGKNFNRKSIFSERTVFDAAGLVCEKMITEDMLPEGEKVGDIIDYLCYGKRVKDAFSVYKSAREKKLNNIPRKSLKCLVNSLCARKNEDDDYVNLAVQMLHELDDICQESVTGNFDENGNNDRCITVAKKWVHHEDISSVVNLLSGSLPSLKSKLDDMKVNLDEELVRRVLLHCEYHGLPRNNLIDFVKWAAGRDNRIVNKKILGELIKVVPFDPNTKPVYKLLSFLQEAVCRYNVSMTTEMLNGVIYLFFDLGEGMAANFVFNNFENLQCERDADSYYLTIQALYHTDTVNYKDKYFDHKSIFSERTVFDAAALVCEKMITEDMLPEGEKVGDIIEYLCFNGMVKDAISVYKSAREKKLNNIPRKSLRRLVDSLCAWKDEDDDYENLAVQMLHEMPYIWEDEDD